jgi:hypothetical protein
MSQTKKAPAFVATALLLALTIACGRADMSGPVASGTRTASPVAVASPGSPLASCANSLAPSPRIAASITYESTARQFLLFGGDTLTSGGGIQSSAETWLWNGQSWTQNNGTGPSARAYPVMDYDNGRGVVILYGGQYDEAGKSVVSLFDTWLWDGARWAVKSSAPQPKLRAPIGVYDEARGNLVLFGIGNTGPETWLWNGSQWSAANPAHSPDPRQGAAMAYVASTKQVVLFGGFALGLGRLNDTWVWDGSDWRNLSLTQVPLARVNPTFVSGQEAILFGGGGDAGPLADVWRWNGTGWIQVKAAHSPTARRAAAGASDGTYTVVTGGGDSAGLLNDVWRWDSNDWKQC